MMRRMWEHSWLAIVAACVASAGCGQYNDGFGGDDLEGADISESEVAACKNTLAGGEKLNAGQYRCSSNGNYKFGVSSNGNLELLQGSSRLWSAETSGSTNLAAMQRDGNLVVRNSGNNALWSSRTAGKTNAMLTVENDGRAVIRHNGSTVWSVGGGNSGGGGGDTGGDTGGGDTGGSGGGSATGELKIVVFSVASGDAALIVFPTGKTMMVDSATSANFQNRILPFLKRHGLKHLDYYVETHPHPDHAGGRDLLKSNGFVNGATVTWDWNTHRYGKTFKLENANWFISNARDTSFHGSDANYNSLAFRFDYNGFVYSAGGDEGSKSQKRFLQDHPNLVPAHVRNTAHHMYGPVDSNFLVATNPYLFIVSNSKSVREEGAFRNTFLGAVNRLKNQGGRFKSYAITGETGHVIIRASGGQNWKHEFCANISTCVVRDFP